jgi:hypothetical protein
MTGPADRDPSPATGGPKSPGPSLQTIAEAARERVPGVDEVGLCEVDALGHVATRAATSDLVRRLHAVQQRLGAGPVLDLRSDPHPVAIPSLRREQRWPGYADAAAAVGVQAELVVPVPVNDASTTVVLDLCSLGTEQIHPDAETVARLFAGHAAVLLSSDTAGLLDALRAREVVGQATGIVAERYEMSAERAFAFLVRAASHSNMTLREVAEELVQRQQVDHQLADRGLLQPRNGSTVAGTG